VNEAVPSATKSTPLSGCNTPARIPKVYIDYKAFRLFQLWASQGGKKNREFTAFGRLQNIEGNLAITEAYLMKHKGSSGSVELDEEDHIKMMMELDKRGVPPDEAFGCWVHSHPGSGPNATYLSSVDESNITGLLDHAQMIVSIVFDSNGQYPYTRIDLKHPRVKLPTQLEVIDYFMSKELAEAEKLFEEKSRSMAEYTGVGYGNIGYGSYQKDKSRHRSLYYNYYNDEYNDPDDYSGWAGGYYSKKETNSYSRGNSTLDEDVFKTEGKKGGKEEKGNGKSGKTSTPSQLKLESANVKKEKEDGIDEIEKWSKEKLVRYAKICIILSDLENKSKTKEEARMALMSLGEIESDQTFEMTSLFDTKYTKDGIENQKEMIERINYFLNTCPMEILVEAGASAECIPKSLGEDVLKSYSSEKTYKFSGGSKKEKDQEEEEDVFELLELDDEDLKKLDVNDKEQIENIKKHIEEIICKVQMQHIQDDEAVDRLVEIGLEHDKAQEVVIEAQHG